MPKRFNGYKQLAVLSRRRFSDECLTQDRFEELLSLWKDTKEFHKKRMLGSFLQALAAQFSNWTTELDQRRIGLCCEMAARIRRAAYGCPSEVLAELYLLFSTDAHCRQHLMASVENALLTDTRYTDPLKLVRQLGEVKSLSNYSALLTRIDKEFFGSKNKKSDMHRKHILVFSLYRTFLKLRIRASDRPQIRQVLKCLDTIYLRMSSSMTMRTKVELAKCRMAIIAQHTNVMQEWPEFGHRLAICQPQNESLLAIILACETDIPNSLTNSPPGAKQVRKLCKSLYAFCRNYPHHRPSVENYSSLLVNWLMRSKARMEIATLAQCDACISRFSSICQSSGYHQMIRKPIVDYAQRASLGQLYNLLRAYENTLVAPEYLASVIRSRILEAIDGNEFRLLVRIVYALAILGLVDSEVLDTLRQKMTQIPLKKHTASRLIRLASAFVIADRFDNARLCLSMAENCINFSSSPRLATLRQWERLAQGLNMPLPEQLKANFSKARNQRAQKPPTSSFLAKEVAKELRAMDYTLTLEAPRCGFFIDILVSNGHREIAIECDNPMFHRVISTKGNSWLCGIDRLKEKVLAANSITCLRFTLESTFESAKRHAEKLDERLEALELLPQAVLA